MTLLDLLLILTVFGFIWFGFWFGIIHMAGSLLGTIAGAWLAGHYYDVLSAWLNSWLGISGGWVTLASFLIIFIVVNRLVGFIFYLLDRTFNFLRFIPFLATVNRLAGAVLGFLEGALVLGLTLYFASRLPLPLLVENSIAASGVAARLIAFASVLVPLLPDIIKQIQPYVPSLNLPIPK
ncbi:CvpA family protein [Patescibacteria group bacterium]|nr:CvpA family protein [Patescibacteria group bacterium]